MAHLWDRWRAAGLTVNALPLERSATARPLPIGKGLRGQVLLAVADGPVRREVHASMALALAAARRHGDQAMALDYVLASGEPDGEAWAFADAALAAADRPTLRASGCALAAARLACPDLAGEVVGSVRHRRGQTDVYAMRLPEAES